MFETHSESRSLTEICFTHCQCCSQLAQHNQLLLGTKQQPAPANFANLLPYLTVAKELHSLLLYTQKWLCLTLQLPLILLKHPSVLMFYRSQIFYRVNTPTPINLSVSPHWCCELQVKFITAMLSSNCDGVKLRNKRRIYKHWQWYTLQNLFLEYEPPHSTRKKKKLLRQAVCKTDIESATSYVF